MLSPKQQRNDRPMTPERDTIGWREGGLRLAATWSKQEPVERSAEGVAGQWKLSEAAVAHRLDQAAERQRARTDPRLNGSDARRRVRT